MKILVLGATGMLGNTIFRYCFNDDDNDAWGTVRSSSNLDFFSDDMKKNLMTNIDVTDQNSIVSVLSKVKPDVVINCIGLIKQLSHAHNPLNAIPINAMLPHQIANLCELSNTRLIHISTDCVFSGKIKLCKEGDNIEPPDLYGMSKYIGEVHDRKNVVTLRTSIIGHELASKFSLVEWFLSQTDQVKGFTNAIFSGFPTIELAKIIIDYILPNKKLCGLYHVSSEPIDKSSLLKLIAEIYNKEIEVIDDPTVVIDRSLDSTLFKSESGYKPPSWRSMIKSMREFQ